MMLHRCPTNKATLPLSMANEVADPDECFADECELPTTVMAAFLKRIWDYLVEKAKEEP